MAGRVGDPRKTKTRAQVGHSVASTRSEVVDLADVLEGVRRELAATKLERDEYCQEMFESNRYAAWLTHRSLDISTVAPQPGDAAVSGDLTDIPGYITRLEGKLWAAETNRIETMNYVQYLEGLCWELETRRLAAGASAASRLR